MAYLCCVCVTVCLRNNQVLGTHAPLTLRPVVIFIHSFVSSRAVPGQTSGNKNRDNMISSHCDYIWRAMVNVQAVWREYAQWQHHDVTWHAHTLSFKEGGWRRCRISQLGETSFKYISLSCHVSFCSSSPIIMKLHVQYNMGTASIIIIISSLSSKTRFKFYYSEIRFYLNK